MSERVDFDVFLNDLISVFNKHHVAILWKAENMVFIREDAHVVYLGRNKEDVIMPVCSTTDLDKLIKLDDGD